MKTICCKKSPSFSQTGRHDRGSVLITTLVFAGAIAICLAHRTFLADSAVNLAETGIEEAVWSFNKMGNSVLASDINAAWDPTIWNRTNTIGDAYMTNTGIGYTSAPTVTISGGGGSGATGVATITTAYFDGGTTSTTRVTNITITNPGSGYTSTPTISLSGGGGSGATAVARFAATRTLTFNNLDGGATGTVKVWVAGYNGTAVVPTVVAKASVTFPGGQPIEKIVKVVLGKNAPVQKGLVAFNGINWNGHPLADSYLSGAAPGVPPFSLYNPATARSNTTVASLNGPQIDLSQGTVDGNVLTGSGVTVVGHGDISGNTIGNFTFPFTMTSAPSASYTPLGTIPATLPNLGSVTDPVTGVTSIVPTDAATVIDGKTYYCYSVAGKTIGALTVAAGYNVIIKGTSTNMASGLVLTVSGTKVATAKIFMDGRQRSSRPLRLICCRVSHKQWAHEFSLRRRIGQHICYARMGTYLVERDSILDRACSLRLEAQLLILGCD